jgi:hypothetical protein
VRWVDRTGTVRRLESAQVTVAQEGFWLSKVSHA